MVKKMIAGVMCALMLTGCGVPSGGAKDANGNYDVGNNTVRIRNTYIYFTCDGTTGLYTYQDGISAVPNHERCKR